MSTNPVLLIPISLVLMTGCTGHPPAPETVVVVTVVDDENQPVSRSTVRINDQPTKKGGLPGTFTQTMTLKEGTPFTVTVLCPKGHEPIPTAMSDHVVRWLQPLGTPTNSPQSIQRITRICLPLTKEHVVVIKTNLPIPVPVTINNKVVGQTNADGVAQFVIAGLANDDVRVMIDTSELKGWSPAMPARVFSLPRKRRFLVFDQKFTRTPPPVKFRRKERHTRKRKRPIRL